MKDKLISAWYDSKIYKLIKEVFIDTKSEKYIDTKGMPSGDDTQVIKFGLRVLFIVFVLFGGWMAFAPLTTSAVSVGKVSADTDKKVVQHLQGGNIAKILVKEGDIVKKDQVLIELDIVQSKSEAEAVKKQYMHAIATEAR
ncbi:MAG: biotin/lipoyl-binding protein, partial [Erysipelotrichia bacterium]|nr:biotin/lipoyl-binding protein [Erysipelotrichia bacterium]